MKRRHLSIALVHHPVLDAKGEIVASTLTTMDVHDLSRSARTYGCEAFYVVHPIEAQRKLAHQIVEHWTHGSSAKRIPDRKDALAVVRVVTTLDEALAGATDTSTATKKATDPKAKAHLWVTAARVVGKTSTAWSTAHAELHGEGPPVLLVFGTSWGLAPEVMDRADAILEPIVGAGDWNHLSVRAACAIALDRLVGQR